jgi:cell wall assembly regulator SMI1
MRDVDASLTPLSTWLNDAGTKLCDVFEPDAPANVERAERAFGRPLPADYRHFLLRCGGQKLVPSDGAWRLASLAQGHDLLGALFALSEYEDHRAFSADDLGRIDARGPVKALYANDRWWPFMTLYGASHCLCLDLDPTPGGTPGQVIYGSPKDDVRRVIAPTFGAFLRRFVDAIAAMLPRIPPEWVELPEDFAGRL